jgi:hypothetical protein
MNLKILCAAFLAASPFFISAQVTDLKLDDLSQFKSPSSNWSIVGNVSSDYTKNEDIQITSGKGILVNKPADGARGDLYSAFEHGDIDIELEFMMPKHSNSGIYLQGKYEVQLFNSWGIIKPKASDCGGIYERWDDSRPEGLKGYDGVPPRLNPIKAPGLWNKLKLSFKAPVFKDGKKVKKAMLVYLYINGALIHEDLELGGPTRGATDGGEVALAPLRIQGDHGSIAFRNIKYELCDPNAKIKVYDIDYAYYEQAFGNRLNVWDFKPKKTGKLDLFSIEMVEVPNSYLVSFNSKMEITKGGDYTFETGFSGLIYVVIDKDTIIRSNYHDRLAMRNMIKTVSLKPGTYNLHIDQWKYHSWLGRGFGLYISGPGIKMQQLHHLNSLPPVSEPLPHIVSTEFRPKVYRAFLKFDNKSITHTAFVGDPTKLHYAINPENMAFLEFWKGDFLDMGPAWDERGGFPVKTLGDVNSIRNAPSIATLSDNKAAWPDSVDKSNFKFKGYYLDENKRPRFTYLTNGLTVNDKFTPVDNGRSLNRELKIEGKSDTKNLYCLVAVASAFSQQKDGSYIAGDKEYFIKVDPSLKPMIRDANGKKEMIVPVSLATGSAKVSYSIIW